MLKGLSYLCTISFSYSVIANGVFIQLPENDGKLVFRYNLVLLCSNYTFFYHLAGVIYIVKGSCIEGTPGELMLKAKLHPTF